MLRSILRKKELGGEQFREGGVQQFSKKYKVKLKHYHHSYHLLRYTMLLCLMNNRFMHYRIYSYQLKE